MRNFSKSENLNFTREHWTLLAPLAGESSVFYKRPQMSIQGQREVIVRRFSDGTRQHATENEPHRRPGSKHGAVLLRRSTRETSERRRLMEIDALLSDWSPGNDSVTVGVIQQICKKPEFCFERHVSLWIQKSEILQKIRSVG